MSAGDQRYLPDALPVPEVNEVTRALLTSGALALQTCVFCRTVQHPPGEICFTCGAVEFDYVETEPVGVVSSHTVVHHATHPALKDAVPYNVVIVELRDAHGVQMVGNLVTADLGDLVIGRRVVGRWTVPLERDGQEPVRLLQWHPAPDDSPSEHASAES